MKTAMLVLFMGAGATTAFAICPHPTPKACGLFFRSDVVFVGTVLSEQPLGDYVRYRLRVSKVLRGSFRGVAAVYSENNSSRVLWKVGNEYVVFAALRNGRLEAWDECGPLSDSTRVSETIREIEALRNMKGAMIEGEVLARLPEGDGVSGVSVSVLGSGRSYETISDPHGLFRLPLPAGHYRVVIDPTLARHSDYNLWVDPGDITLVPGQCAQLQFVAH